MEYLAVKVIDKISWQESNSESNGTLGLLHFSYYTPYYAIDLQNLNDWSWSDFAPIKSETKTGITLGYSDAHHKNGAPSILLFSFPQNKASLSFGVSSSQSQFYSELNSDQDIVFALNFAGIALLHDQYSAFTNLMHIAT